MQILLIEPYYGGSHRAWADGYRNNSRHDIHILSLPAQFWKWRMQGGAVTLARRFQQSGLRPDIILASDMIDLTIFRALTREQTTHIPVALYFHENQLSYPQNKRQGHGWRYGFINYASALAADQLYFNSQYHLDDFFSVMPDMLRHFGDHNETGSIDWLRQKADVLPVGLNLKRLDRHRVTRKDHPPVILWNHRWEFDKNPHGFFRALYALDEAGYDFQVVMLGENFGRQAAEFEAARQRLAHRILHFGYASGFSAYARWLWRSKYVASAALHDFFGIAIAEAMYCGCIPILPWRMNYPALVPEAWHDACLYGQQSLTDLLAAHLRGEYSVPASDLQMHIAPYDWTIVAAQYDDELERLASAYVGPARLEWDDM